MSSSRVEDASHWAYISFKHFYAKHANDVPHIAQSKVWDCGVACVQMAMQARGIRDVNSVELREQVATESVWSIDLAYLLAGYGLSATFYTSNAGVRPEYDEQEFYRHHLTLDKVRVTQLFANASKRNVSVVLRNTSLDHIRTALTFGQQLVLVLVDKRLLRCELCSPKLRRFDDCSHSGFLGHYVLLTHFHYPRNVFLMKDSSRQCMACVINADVLESARCAFGTDLDTICVTEGCSVRQPQEN